MKSTFIEGMTVGVLISAVLLVILNWSFRGCNYNADDDNWLSKMPERYNPNKLSEEYTNMEPDSVWTIEDRLDEYNAYISSLDSIDSQLRDVIDIIQRLSSELFWKHTLEFNRRIK